MGTFSRFRDWISVGVCPIRETSSEQGKNVSFDLVRYSDLEEGFLDSECFEYYVDAEDLLKVLSVLIKEGQEVHVDDLKEENWTCLVKPHWLAEQADDLKTYYYVYIG